MTEKPAYEELIIMIRYLDLSEPENNKSKEMLRGSDQRVQT